MMQPRMMHPKEKVASDMPREIVGRSSNKLNQVLRDSNPPQNLPQDGGISIDAAREDNEYDLPVVEFMTREEYWKQMYGEDND